MKSPRVSNDVVIYARYSTLMQDSRSIDDQERRCRAYADAHGMTVVEVYSDAAESGSHLERPGLQRMLTDARGRGAFRTVLVDDLSRLSRDQGDSWNIVFRDLADRDVVLIDVTTGMSSTDPSARTMFAAVGMGNDQFLQLVRKETHRGLEGRALAGFWAGGRCFGYATVEEENPPDTEHPRKRPIIDEPQAATVRRVFQLFADGQALKKIAAALNDEGLPAPNDGGRGNKIGRGWGHTTIRSMLLNERYIGRTTWNRHKWLHASGKKNRRRVKRPESEWIRREHPELAIVDRELWDAVQARFTRRGQGRPPGACRHRTPLVSGLMRCGDCGGSMNITSRKVKAGVSYAQFGCVAHYSRGAAICPNNLTVSEKKVTAALVAALKETLSDPEVLGRFVDQAQRRIAAASKKTPGPADEVERRVRECERRLANLTETLAKLGWSDAIGAKLKAEEEQLSRLKSERTTAKDETSRPIPHPTLIAADFGHVLGILSADPVRGREILSRFVAPLVMTPKGKSPDRSYRATGAFDLSFFLAPHPGVGNSSCAGRI
jgi:site-specific DNA recombinase